MQLFGFLYILQHNNSEGNHNQNWPENARCQKNHQAYNAAHKLHQRCYLNLEGHPYTCIGAANILA